MTDPKQSRVPAKPHVAIIGAGLTGLSAACAILESGGSVRVFESSDRVGGAIGTDDMDGFLRERSTNSMMLKCKAVEDFLQRLGLEDYIQDSSTAAKHRYLYRDGQVVIAPYSLGSFIRTPLFSTPAKLRLFKEPFVRRYTGNDEETLASFVERRLGREALDYGAGPFVSGIYAGNPSRLSVRHAFPTLWQYEQDAGSIMKGAIRSRKAKRKAGTLYKTRMISFAGGMATLPHKMASIIGHNLLTETEIREIRSNDGNSHSAKVGESQKKWIVRWKEKCPASATNSTSPTAPDGASEESFDAIVLASPAHTLPHVPFPDPIRTQLQLAREIEYPPVTTVLTGHRRKDVSHPLDGFGILFPGKEKRRILGTLFSSSLFEGRAPDGHIALTTYIGGAITPEYAEGTDSQIKKLVMEELGDTLGVTGQPIAYGRIHWPHAIPQYNLGHGRFMAQFEALEQQFPGLHFCGNYRTGIGAGDCLKSGLDIASKLC